MANIEQVGNQGYIAFETEAVIGTPLTPTVFAILEDETMTTNPGHHKVEGIFANLAQTFTVVPGMRKHTGDITLMAEPNTAVELFDALLPRNGAVSTIYTFTVTSANATIGATYTNNSVTFTVTATIASQTTLICTASAAPSVSGTLTKATGTGDATITFSAFTTGTSTWQYLATLGTPLTLSKTIDISTGDVVKRFYGCMISKITPAWKDNEMTLKATVSALGSFQGRTIASVSGSGPYTVVLDTTYDPSPTTGLVVADNIRFYTPGTYTPTSATVASITNGTTFTTSTNVSSYSANSSVVYLAPNASPTFSLLPNFLWTNTQFIPGATASAALSATQLRVEQGSSWEVDYSFNNDTGEQRSGGNDPQSLPRTTVNADLTIKKFFHYPDDIQNMNLLTKGAWQIRHYAYTANSAATYELRITFNHAVTSNPLPQLKPKETEYSNIKYDLQYDNTDGQMYSVTVINTLATIG